MITPALCLASQSVSRAALLRAAGLTFETCPAYLDEEMARHGFEQEGLSPAQQADRLAEMKAVKVSLNFSGFVIGADQILNLGNQCFAKPKDMEEARANLQQLCGQTHYLETAIVLCRDGMPVWRHLARPKLIMRNFSDEFLDDYLQTAGEDVLSSVGAYQLEKTGIQLFEQIEGDYFSILGLPLLPLLEILRQHNMVMR